MTKGSGVVNGQILVSGLDETKQGDMRYLRANAKVYADITEKQTLSIPKKVTYSYAGENYVDRKNFRFLWLDFPCINDVVLPVGFKIRTDRELVTTENSVSKNKAEEIAKADCILYEIFTKNKSKVISKQISVKENKGSYRVTTDYIFNENIADQVDFDVTE